jgi:murein L,D-transpeptidase YafK
MSGRASVAQRLEQYGPAVRARLAADFGRIGIAYPPRRVLFVGLKLEKQLEVWVAGEGGKLKFLKVYPVLGASGQTGPKLREGDRQVPEGFYAIEALNPNSVYHLSIRLNYPNEEDKARARAERRSKPGTDIMIHGGTDSVGCLAMGDEAAEDLFVLVAETGARNASVILAPVDFRARGLPADTPPLPAWAGELYRRIRAELGKLGAKL